MQVKEKGDLVAKKEEEYDDKQLRVVWHGI